MTNRCGIIELAHRRYKNVCEPIYNDSTPEDAFMFQKAP
jgi:hypothetical protein